MLWADQVAGAQASEGDPPHPARSTPGQESLPPLGVLAREKSLLASPRADIDLCGCWDRPVALLLDPFATHRPVLAFPGLTLTSGSMWLVRAYHWLLMRHHATSRVGEFLCTIASHCWPFDTIREDIEDISDQQSSLIYWLRCSCAPAATGARSEQFDRGGPYLPRFPIDTMFCRL